MILLKPTIVKECKFYKADNMIIMYYPAATNFKLSKNQVRQYSYNLPSQLNFTTILTFIY